ncbi:MAG: CHRD domain-containing protein, partial [Armatimonadetes bacterium]|nr:CHRD domain-containing protein [Armatimonadota bacterium]
MKNITCRRMLSSIAFAAFLFAGLAGGTACSDADDNGPFALFRAILRANQEVNNPASNAEGLGTVRVFTNRAQIDVAMTHSGLTNVTAAHIHFGDLGVNGSPIFTLFNGTGTFASPLTRTLLPGDFVPVPGLATFADAENAIQTGRCYLNVHTAAFPGGEIRGQIGPANLDAALDGVEEVPPVTTAALGTLTINGNGGQDTFTVGL